MFHSEHNRLRDEIDGHASTADNGALEAGFKAAGWGYEERLFQAARFVNEMEYQHAVFEEFARKFSPAIAAVRGVQPAAHPGRPGRVRPRRLPVRPLDAHRDRSIGIDVPTARTSASA